MKKWKKLLIIFTVLFATVTSAVYFPKLTGASNGGHNGIPGLLSLVRYMLDNIQPTWSRILPTEKRFKMVLNGKAVLDRETGLVWAQHPGEMEEPDVTYIWSTALANCYSIDIAGRRGWRLPTVEELASLIEPSETDPALPSGHPFINVHDSKYWSATTRVDAPNYAWSVDFGSGLVGNAVDKNTHLFWWCVRTGQGIDGVQ